jgi:flagellar L-ring protein precursor FlgH
MNRFMLTAFALLILVPQLGTSRSLWTEDSQVNSLFTGANASKVGDIITIIVEENNQATDIADSQADRQHEFNGIFSVIFNNAFMNKVFGAGQQPQLQFNSSNNFQGDSQIGRESTFATQIAATIVKIDQVGNYLIEARKTLRVGEEQKIIVLSGKIRPQDISVDNTVNSQQVADAEISYLGSGTLTKMANPTFIQRFFNFIF